MPEPAPKSKPSPLRKEMATIPVVGIGASAGGLEAFIRLIESVPEHTGMAYVLIQHLSPNHESMMAELLGAHTHMTVRQIDHGMNLERDCVYVNAPGQNVSLSGDALLISDLPAGPQAHLPFDFFLTTLALERNGHAMCVILSGTGKDGSIGLKSVKRVGGFVIAQDPEDAEFDGMPKSAIQTGDVDAVLPAGKIPAALMNWNELPIDPSSGLHTPQDEAPPAWLSQIIFILREQTGSDFSLYKPGTLVRRITRRMSLLSENDTQASDYVKLLRNNPQECEALAADLLINVTQFFRDPEVFEFLEREVIPDLVRKHSADSPLRVWVAGCSSGEEVWSLAMVLHEAIEADGRNIRLQILASDVDADALTTARAGVYPHSVASDISEARLARFFTPDERGFKIRDSLRGQTVFTRQNLISDPPFARLDLISCRNVMIYLGQEAQAKIISYFQFSLVTGGILLLGASETGGDVSGRFEVVSKPARVYRRLGKRAAADAESANSAEEPGTPPFILELDPPPDARYADVSRRAVAQFFTPASVLVSRQGACLHFMGSVDQYLDVAPGSASFDILPMVPLSHRAALREAIATAGPAQPLKKLAGLKPLENGKSKRFISEVRFLPEESEELILITFQASPDAEAADGIPSPAPAEFSGLERNEIDGLRREIEHTSRLLERALEIERKTRRETLRLNEEYQATNEELVTSKEELQALNEELMVMNSQLQESLETQRTTSNDLTNVLFSTNVATIFLDSELCIRFFTPATRSVFGIIAADVGRPLEDLQSRAPDKHLLDDAREVLQSQGSIDREITTPDGIWFQRRMLPYKTQANEIEGLVITYVNVQEQHRATENLEGAIRQAEQAVIAKTRFLASASHDLRQPLQTLTFVHNLLARDTTGADTQHMLKQMDQAVSAMSGMLSTLLDINKIEAGVISYQLEDIPVSEVISNLYAEFRYHAQAKSLELRMAPSSATIRTDRRLLEQMLRNLLSNAIRYTDAGGILIGVRRRNGRLRIEIWDTGIGIPGTDLTNVFSEYHKVDRMGRTATEGLGLGLSIVQRLADLLGHQIGVRSAPGKGSVFSIEVNLADGNSLQTSPVRQVTAVQPKPNPPAKATRILVVEDETDLRMLIELMLVQSGYEVTSAASFEQAVALANEDAQLADLLVADYNLPNGHNGLELARLLRQQGNNALPVIILTGDISSATAKLIAQEQITQLNKPTRHEELEAAIHNALKKTAEALPPAVPVRTGKKAKAQVIIVDDDSNFCENLMQLLEADGLRTSSFASGETFLAELDTLAATNEPVCVLIDAYLGGISGFDVLDVMQQKVSAMTAIMITGNSDIRMSVHAMKSGALDFIEKPIDLETLRASIDLALEAGRDAASIVARKIEAAKRLSKLTVREREVLDRILSGQPNKNVAADLGISQRTVESHRASVMSKSGCKTLPELVRLAVRAS
ncbi:MAG: CheR family methyltransferase [Pannonibacter sp.]